MTNSIGTIANVPGYSGITFNIGSYITENGSQVNINACYNEPFEMTKGSFTYYRSAVWREIYNDEIWYDVFCPVSIEDARMQVYDSGGGRLVNGEENEKYVVIGAPSIPVKSIRWLPYTRINSPSPTAAGL